MELSESKQPAQLELQQQQAQLAPDKKAPTPTNSKYVRDFESLFVPIRVENLRVKARAGQLRHCQFRSLCWRYFLLCLPEQYDQWLASCHESRARYDKIKAKHLNLKQALTSLSNNSSPNSTPDLQSTTTTTPTSHPISNQSSSTPSPTAGPTSIAAQINKDKKELLLKRDHQIDEDLDIIDINDDSNGGYLKEVEEIKARRKEIEEEQEYLKAANQCDHKNVLKTIERDVVRTFPDMEFFRLTEMQGILERVLFHYASENLHLSYKQGMHELLATILYVLHTDYQNCLINNQGGYANDTIATLLDIKYLEHDTYELFSALMKSLQTWYQNDEILTTPPQQSASTSISSLPSSPSSLANLSSSAQNYRLSSSSSQAKQQVTSVLGSKLKLISENIVRIHDTELFNHLEALQIAPQIYGIRWMRLLFGREFEFLDLLTVWDAIICDKISMSLTNYIFASMLITIRDELVNGDYTDCLNNLMRHQFKDVQYVIKLALYLRNPDKHTRPKPLHSGTRKNFSHFQQQYHQPQKHNISSGSSGTTKKSNSSEKSLTSRLSQQYISVKQQIQQANSRYEQWTASSQSSSGRLGRGRQQSQQQLIQRSQQQQLQQQQVTSPNQQYHNRSSAGNNHMLLPLGKPIREYEMREMQTTSSGSSSRKDKPTLGNIYKKDSRNNLSNISSESYEDLHSIVDYCWRLLSEQIDSLQRCLPKEKSLHSEDEIFVALAQLKKVRDVLKGSLRLEDELESASHVDDMRK